MTATADSSEQRRRRRVSPALLSCAVAALVLAPVLAACENGGSGDSVPALPGKNAPMPSGISPPPAVRDVSPTPELRGEQR